MLRDDLTDPTINIRYGSWYLRHLLDKYGNERLALAAYNAGQHNVDEWEAAGKGIQFGETRHYVKRVEDMKKVYRHAYAHMFMTGDLLAGAIAKQKNLK